MRCWAHGHESQSSPHLLSDSGCRSVPSAGARPPSPGLQAGPKPVIPLPGPQLWLPRPLPPVTFSPQWGWGMAGAFGGGTGHGGGGMGREGAAARQTSHRASVLMKEGEGGWGCGLHTLSLAVPGGLTGCRSARRRACDPCHGSSGSWSPPLLGPTAWALYRDPERHGGASPSLRPQFPHPSKEVSRL